MLGIGKKTKSFDQIDFDREDFGMVDDDEGEEDEEKGEGYDNDLEAEERAFIEKEMKEVKAAKKAASSNDLFDQGSDDEEDKEDPTIGKSSFEIRQMKVSLRCF